MRIPRGEINFISDCHLTELVGDTYYVYNDESVFCQNSVRTIKLGKRERDAHGKPVHFASVSDADNWVKNGKIIHPKVQFGA